MTPTAFNEAAMNSSRKAEYTTEARYAINAFNEAAMNSSRKERLYNQLVFMELRGILREPSLR